MADEHRAWKRQGEASWRAHHEAWKRSDLNQRQYCEAHGLPQKAFENWRQKFRAEPQPPVRKLLYRRGGLSHPLSHGLSHPFSHPFSPGTYPSSLPPAPIVPPAREGHRRRFSDADKRRILEEAAQPEASVAQSRSAARIICSRDRMAAQTGGQPSAPSSPLPSSTTSSPSPTSGTCWNAYLTATQ